jgi:hypothetical protein
MPLHVAGSVLRERFDGSVLSALPGRTVPSALTHPVTLKTASATTETATCAYFLVDGLVDSGRLQEAQTVTFCLNLSADYASLAGKR